MKKILKSTRFFMVMLFLVFMIGSQPIIAEAETTGDWTYKIDGSGVTITGYLGDDSVVEIPSTVDGYRVSSIGKRAFYNNVTLKEVTIPEKITSIGAEAFRGCIALTKINFNAIKCEVPNMSSSCGVFSGAGAAAFSLDVVFGPEVHTVPDNLFNSDLEKGYDYSHITSVKFSDSITRVGAYAFDNCEDLTKVVMGKNVKEIDLQAFSDCYGLNEVVLNNNLNKIYASAFENCKAIKSLNLGTSISEINAYAFYNCHSLETLTIPESVTYIGKEAFYNTVKLSRINFNAKNCSVLSFSSGGKGAFSGAGSGADSLKVVFGSKVKTVPANLFNTNREQGANYAYVTSIVFSDAVTVIGDYAFDNCESLEKVTLGKNVSEIKVNAFADNYSLKSVTATSKLKTIADGAFDYNRNMTKFYIPRSSEVSYGNNAFRGCDSLKFHCYYGSAARSYAKEKGIKTVSLTPKTPKLSSVVNQSGAIKVSWKRATGAEGYEVYRKTGTGSYKKVATIKKASTVNYIDKSVTAGKKYTYKVRAYVGDKKGEYSSTISRERLKAPVIQNIKVQKKSLLVTWKKSTGAAKYIVYRKKGNGSYVKVSTVTGLSYTDKKATSKGVKYRYKIIAVDGASKSVASAIKSVTR